MQRTWKQWLAGALMACCLSGLPAAAAAAEETGAIGIILLHGKTGQAAVVSSGVADPLRQAGFMVEAPTMAWSKDRFIDKTYEQALDELEQAVDRLKAKGAGRIVIAGHSMGGNAALAYAAYRGGVAGIILLAPGHSVDARSFRALVATDVAKAKAMLDRGEGDKVGAFADTNNGQIFTRQMKAAIYYSFFQPEGMAAMTKSAGLLSPAVPVLYAAGSDDPLTANQGLGYLFNKLPANPLNRYVVVKADHLGTPAAAVPVMIAWLKELAKQ